jgi:NitT/TauT family transport system substrate-binding protein
MSPAPVLRRLAPLLALLLGAACAGPSAPAAPASKADAAASATSAARPPATSGPAASTAPSPAALAPLEPRERVQVGVGNSVSDAGLFVAQDFGYFAAQGLDVELIFFDSAANQIAPLGTGELDVGAGSPSVGLFNAIARDVPLLIVADKGSVPPGFGYLALVVQKELVDSGAVQGPADLRGRKVAINQPGVSTQVYEGKALEAGGLGLNDVETIILPFPDMAAALANRNVDAAIVIEPNVTAVVERGIGVRMRGLDELYPNHQTAVLIYGPQFARVRTEVANRFMLAYLQAVRDYNAAFTRGTNKAAVVNVLAKYTPIKDPAVYDKMAPAGLNPNGYVNRESIAADLVWYADNAGLRVQLDPAALIDDRFVDYALGVLGR